MFTEVQVLPLLPDALLESTAYRHPVDQIELIETHLSWVFLTGSDAYKVKKPVSFDFVDFSTLALRRHFCVEEVRCNRAFAADLYLGVVPIVLQGDGNVVIDPQTDKDSNEIIDYAVHMRQFDGELQADRLLARGQLSIAEMHAFGGRLAEQHAQLPELDAAYEPGQAIVDNFKTLRSVRCTQTFAEELTALEAQAQSHLSEFGDYLQQRHRQHFVRECHGDLHLSNLARLESGITAFDCLEFDQSLRYIDVWCDAGFLFMDCCIRDRADLAYAFVDGYLDVAGDYAGVKLLPMFAAYRSVVRAKIAALRYAQVAEPQVWDKLQRHLDWPLAQQSRETGRLYVTCGLSGSGKSYWTKQLAPLLPGLRLRSDVLRKTGHGLAALERSHAAVGEGIYRAGASAAVYSSLGEYAATLLAGGEHVIVDAACLHRAQREVLYASAANVGAQVRLLYFTAPPDVLRARIIARQAAADDPSEADVAVLDWQLGHFEAPVDAEPVITLDTTTLSLDGLSSVLQQ